MSEETLKADTQGGTTLSKVWEEVKYLGGKAAEFLVRIPLRTIATAFIVIINVCGFLLSWMKSGKILFIPIIWAATALILFNLDPNTLVGTKYIMSGWLVFGILSLIVLAYGRVQLKLYADNKDEMRKHLGFFFFTALLLLITRLQAPYVEMPALLESGVAQYSASTINWATGWLGLGFVDWATLAVVCVTAMSFELFSLRKQMF